MCGITGIFDPVGQLSGGDAQALCERMTARIAHRGPDGEGFFSEGPTTFGHRRLSIIDLEGGRQPMASPSGRCVITFNGEIYNYGALRDELAAEGVVFRTHSDTEVIVALYERDGIDAFARLSGMFAFGIWDRERRCLVLARDHLGIKPLYVARDGRRLLFASEIKAVRAGLPATPALDDQAVNAYFARQYVPGPRTIFEGIEALPAGTVLTVDAEGERRRSWWSLPPTAPSKLRGADAAAYVLELLDASVKRHLVSDVPVGVFLSGGIDSSLLLALASRHYDGPLDTFSVGFGDDERVTETRYARLVAERYASTHHEIHVSAADGLAVLPEIMAALDQPLADYAIVPTLIMSRFAGERLKVVLGGEGADELFGGYARYRNYAWADRLAGRGRLGAALPLPVRAPPLFRDEARARLLGDRYIRGAALDGEARLRNDFDAFRPAGAVNAALYADLRGWLVDDLLMKVDKMGMLASIEARVPYLDPALVAAVMSLDGREKVGPRSTKRVLRRAAATLLPSEILERPKQGFTVPVGRWLTGPLRARFEEVALTPGPADAWLAPKHHPPALGAPPSEGDLGLKLWSIFIFRWWAAAQG
jgi:asparagine synthase (glutamine-hydrolysing)